MTPTNLTNHFLIAMPSLQDPNFSRTVTYICQHNQEGAMGIVINRPTDLHLMDVLSHMDITPEQDNTPNPIVYLGGPVQPERGFVLHAPPSTWDASLKISDRIGITTSRDILSAIANGKGPDHSLIALGYAGWAAGQLEQEIAQNSWLNGPASLTILYETQHQNRWKAAAEMLGVANLDLLSGEAGHA